MLNLIVHPARAVVIAAVLAASVTPGPGDERLPRLRPESLAAWTAYVRATEQRHAVLEEPGQFLATRTLADASQRMAALRGGRILIDEAVTTDGDGESIDVPAAMVHHWRGAVFIPGATVDGLVRRLEAGEPGTRQPDVMRAEVLERTPAGLRLFLRVKREKYLTVVYDTEHRVTFARHDAGRVSTSSTATRIVEIAEAGTPQEHALAPGEDHGFLWRWNAYWRYEQVDGGVIAECESVSLSRSVPAVVRFLAGRLIRSTARESMDQTLRTFKNVFGVNGTRPSGE